MLGIGGRGSLDSSRVDCRRGVDLVARRASGSGSGDGPATFAAECFRRGLGTSGAVFERCAAGLGDC